ncbi:MAG: flavodoxin [Chloroflexota bacterium]|nr:flavodoxin [Chloroflexota bacterium]
MGKIGLFFGSNTGKTEMVAYLIKGEFDKFDATLVDVHNIGSTTPAQILGYEFLIFGIPTWNTGQLQDDWDNFMPQLKKMDFNGKKIAIFGLGDQNGYGFNFLDAVGTLADAIMERGADVYGLWPTKGYEFNESKAKLEEFFLGLGVDEDGQTELTKARATKWVGDVKKEFNL